MKDKIKKDSIMLLLGKKSYLIRPIKFSCEFGFCDLTKLIGKSYGTSILIGKEKFTVVKPNIIDFLKKSEKGTADNNAEGRCFDIICHRMFTWLEGG